jgi:hypothetical protein
MDLPHISDENKVEQHLSILHIDQSYVVELVRWLVVYLCDFVCVICLALFVFVYFTIVTISYLAVL